MNNSIQDLAPTKALGAKVLYSALTILKNREMSDKMCQRYIRLYGYTPEWGYQRSQY